MYNKEIEKIFKDKKRTMHYDEIIKILSDKSALAYGTLYSKIRKSEILVSNGAGIYGLKEWSNELEQDFRKKNINKKQILGVERNRYGNETIKYKITESNFKNRTIRIPISVETEIHNTIEIMDVKRKIHVLNYNVNSNTIGGIDILLSILEIFVDDEIYLEIIDTHNLRIFKDYEYDQYLVNKSIYEFKDIETSFNKEIDSEETIEFLNLFRKTN